MKNSTYLNLRSIETEFHFMLIDHRYCLPYMDYDDGDKTEYDEYDLTEEVRLAISYGPNHTIEMNNDVVYTGLDGGKYIDTCKGKPFLSPTLQPGKFVYGLHNVIVSPIDDSVRIVDMWINSYHAKEGVKLEEIIKEAEKILEKITDNIYGDLCSEGPNDLLEVMVRSIVKPQYCFNQFD